MTGAAALLDGRTEVIADLSLRGRRLCRTLSDATDEWLSALLLEACDGQTNGLVLIATGGYGRRELAPGGDLDVWLVHDERREVDRVAERLWYPIWDAGLKLGHAVRTPKQVVTAGGEDLDTATAALSARVIAGDQSIGAAVVGPATDRWRKEG